MNANDFNLFKQAAHGNRNGYQPIHEELIFFFYDAIAVRQTWSSEAESVKS